MKIAGIDPGANGALVVLHNSTLDYYTFPKIGGKISYDDTVRMLVTVLKTVDYVFIEAVHGIAGSASKATFSFGYTCGAIRAAAIIAGTPYEMVTPKVWQSHVWLKNDYVYVLTKAGKKKNDTKATALNCATRIYPKETFISGRGKIEHDGIVDAALIATYGKLKLRK